MASPLVGTLRVSMRRAVGGYSQQHLDDWLLPTQEGLPFWGSSLCSHYFIVHLSRIFPYPHLISLTFFYSSKKFPTDVLPPDWFSFPVVITLYFTAPDILFWYWFSLSMSSQSFPNSPGPSPFTSRTILTLLAVPIAVCTPSYLTSVFWEVQSLMGSEDMREKEALQWKEEHGSCLRKHDLNDSWISELEDRKGIQQTVPF